MQPLLEPILEARAWAGGRSRRRASKVNSFDAVAGAGVVVTSLTGAVHAGLNSHALFAA